MTSDIFFINVLTSKENVNRFFQCQGVKMKINVPVRNPEKLDKHLKRLYGTTLKKKLTQISREYVHKAEHEMHLHDDLRR